MSNRNETFLGHFEVEDENLLLDKWEDLCKRIGIKNDSLLVYRNLIDRYSEPHRAYHKLTHIKMSLSELEQARSIAQDPDAIEMAIWFHDAIYEANKNQLQTKIGDEEKSALLSRIVLVRQLEVGVKFAEKVASLILWTKHTTIPKTSDGKLMVDIDLTIFGQLPEVFDTYEKLIREEYSWVPDNDFKDGRIKVLSMFLPPYRSSIYQTSFFQDKYESQAIKNLTRSMGKLQTSVGGVE